MSSRGNGRGNKRKHPEYDSYNSKKRNFDEGFPRNNNRVWNKRPFYRSGADRMSNHSSGNGGGQYSRPDRYRPNHYHQSNTHRHFDYPPTVSTDSHIGEEKEVTGDSLLNSERLEKVLATKKRIEEAFASKVSDTTNKEMAFEKPVMKGTSSDSKEKNTDGSLPVDSFKDLRLTNSDFKEIGSVASGVEVDTDVGDIILNVSSCSSQQRSFDQVCPSTIPSLSKQPRIGGWNVEALNESETGPLYSNPHILPSRASRNIREQYLQESREKILGSVEPNTEKQNIGSKKTKAGLGNQKLPRVNITRVGQLYQSFLRSRLVGGFTLKLSSSTQKPTGPNPLLDKSVLESHNYNSGSESQTLHLEMPRPIMIKLEANKTTGSESTSNDTEAEEANEFCQEYSHLLTDPNFLIPSEDLEKLGLGHLAEMNKLINKRRSSDGPPITPVNNESFLRVRSLNALNSVTENDITYNPPASNLTSCSVPESPLISNFSNISHTQSALQDTNFAFVNVPGVNQSNISGLNSQVPTNPQSSTMAEGATLSAIPTPVAESLTVESVAEKVITKLFSSTNISPQVLKPHTEFMLRNQILQPNLLPNQNETSTPNLNNSLGHSIDQTKDPTKQLQDITSKILKMFVIDKQIEKLTKEKMETYKELLSIGDISSSLFNSWAEEKLQKRIPVSVPPEQTNDSPNNYHINSLTSTPSSIGLLNEAISKSVQSLLVGSCLTNNSNQNTSVSSQSRESHHSNQLSVRTDLLNTNESPLLNDLSGSIKDTENIPEVLSGDVFVKTELCSEAVNENVSRKSKKKKKGKSKEKPIDIINLIDDSSEEENCDVSVCSNDIGVDPLANDGPSSNTTNYEPTIFNYGLNNLTPTSICLEKGVLLVGCKDGNLVVFEVKKNSPLFIQKVHEESVNCIAVFMKQAIFGSSDATLSVFSLQKQKKTQTVHAPSSVQCVQVSCGKVYAGTRTGQLITYKINLKTNEKGSIEISLKIQDTKKFSNSSIIGLKVTVLEDEEVVIVSTRGEQIAVYYTDTGSLLTTFDWCDSVHCMAVHSQTPLVYCGTNNQSIKVVNFVTGVNEPDCLVGIVRAVTRIIFRSPVLFAASTDGKVYIYDTKINKLISTVTACKGHVIGMQLYKRVIIVASNRCELNAVPIPEKVGMLMRKSAKSKSAS